VAPDYALMFNFKFSHTGKTTTRYIRLCECILACCLCTKALGHEEVKETVTIRCINLYAFAILLLAWLYDDDP